MKQFRFRQSTSQQDCVPTLLSDEHRHLHQWRDDMAPGCAHVMERELPVHMRIETQVKGANILHCNGDMQMNFPQIRTIPAKMASNSRLFSPDKLPFEMMSAGQLELKQE